MTNQTRRELTNAIHFALGAIRGAANRGQDKFDKTDNAKFALDELATIERKAQELRQLIEQRRNLDFTNS